MVLTPEVRRERALAELHQHRPVGLQGVVTLQLDHPSFDEPARVVADNDILHAALETGEVVDFQPVAFRHVGPSSGDGRWPEIEITMDNAARHLEPHLEAALASNDPLTVTLREYIRSHAMEGPGRVIEGLELNRTRAGDLSVSGTAGFFGLDRKFGTVYDPALYPGIG